MFCVQYWGFYLKNVNINDCFALLVGYLLPIIVMFTCNDLFQTLKQFISSGYSVI